MSKYDVIHKRPQNYICTVIASKEDRVIGTGPRVKPTENFMKFGYIVTEILEGQTDKYVHLNTLTTILCTPPGGKAITKCTITSLKTISSIKTGQYMQKFIADNRLRWTVVLLSITMPINWQNEFGNSANYITNSGTPVSYTHLTLPTNREV